MARTKYTITRVAEGYRATIVHHFGAIQSWSARSTPEAAMADIQAVHDYVTLSDIGWIGVGNPSPRNPATKEG